MSLGLSVATNLLAATSQRRYAIKCSIAIGFINRNAKSRDLLFWLTDMTCHVIARVGTDTPVRRL